MSGNSEENPLVERPEYLISGYLLESKLLVQESSVSRALQSIQNHSLYAGIAFSVGSGTLGGALPTTLAETTIPTSITVTLWILTLLAYIIGGVLVYGGKQEENEIEKLKSESEETIQRIKGDSKVPTAVSRATSKQTEANA